MRLFTWLPAGFPTYRPDVCAMADSYLPRQGNLTELVTQAAEPGQPPVSDWPGGARARSGSRGGARSARLPSPARPIPQWPPQRAWPAPGGRMPEPEGTVLVLATDGRIAELVCDGLRLGLAAGGLLEAVVIADDADKYARFLATARGGEPAFDWAINADAGSGPHTLQDRKSVV